MNLASLIIRNTKQRDCKCRRRHSDGGTGKIWRRKLEIAVVISSGSGVANYKPLLIWIVELVLDFSLSRKGLSFPPTYPPG